MRAGLFTSLFLSIFIGLSTAYQSKAQISAVTYPASGCIEGSVTVNFTVTGPSGAPYSIYLVPSVGAKVLLGNTATSPATVTLPGSTSPGTYKIQVISADLADTATGTANIVVNAAPSVPTVTSPVAACAGGSLALSASGTGLKWYTGAGSPLPAAPTVAPGTAGAHNYLVSQTVGGCESEKATITVNVSPPPAPPTLSAAPSPVCVGSVVADAVFTNAVAAGAGTLVWYSGSTGGTPLTAGNITVNTATPGTKSLYVASRVGDCESTRLKVDLLVNAPPSEPAVNNLTVCAGAPLTAGTIVGRVTNTENYVLKWYTAPSGGTSTSSPTAPSTATAGSHNFYVSRTNAGCESDRKLLTVTVVAPPATPTLASGPIADVCQGAPVAPATLTNAIATGTGTLVWYSASTGGAPLSLSTSTINTATTGVKSIYVARKVGDCESDRLKVDITVKTTPPAPVVVNLEACVGQTPAPTLAATGTALKWYTSAGASLSAAPTIVTSAAATFSYQVSQTVSECESPKATITAKVFSTPPPTVTSSIAYCKDEVPATLTATGTGVKWYTAATGGVGTPTPPVVSTATVGSVAYFATQTLNGCESERARVDVRTKAVPVAPTVASLPDVCLATPITGSQLLTAVTAATGTLKWYTVATGGVGTSGAPTPLTTAAGVKNFYVTQSIEACESPRAVISFDVKPLPVAPTAVATADFCHQATATPLTATPTGSNTLKWYTVATAGTALPAAPTPSTTTVQTTSYYVSQSQVYSPTLSCESPRTKIDAVINPLPVVATTTDQAVCQTRTDQNANYLAAVTTPSNTLLWYANETTSTSQTAIPTQNLRTAGEYEYFVAQRSNKQCIGARKAVKIRVKRLPGIPAVSNLEYCQFENAPALTARLETGATPNWYGSNSSGGTASPSAPVPSTADGGTFSYYVSQTVEACEGDRAELKVLVKTTPKPATNSSISYCHNEPSTQLTATGQRLKWYRPNGESQNTPFTPFTASVGDQFFYVTQTGDNNCESPKQEIKITVFPLPSATISGQSSIPLGGTASIQISFTGLGPWSYTLSNGFKGTSTSNNVSIQVQPSFTTSYLVTEVSNACGKGIPNGNAVVTVLRPTITTGNPSVVNICAGSELTVPFQRSGDFPNGSAFVVQVGTQDVHESFKTIPGSLSGNTIKAIIPDTLSGGVYFLRIINENQNADLNTIGSTSGVAITVDPRPTAVLPEDRTIYAGQSTTLSIGLTGAAPWTFSYSDGTQSKSVTTSVTPYSLTLTPLETTTYTVTEVQNRCGVGRSIGETRVQVDQILGTEPTATLWAKVLPTIVDGACNVELEVADFEGIELNIADHSGRSMQRMGLHQQVTPVDVSNLSSGIYFFQIRKSKELRVIKVLKP
jgi:hypothetical protein